MEINKYFPTQEAIDFFLSCGVAEHQAFDCSRVVCSEMINAQVRERSHALEGRIDEPLERSSLLGPVQSPSALINEVSVAVSRHDTEEIFTTASSTNGSPSRSTKMSPADGEGSRKSPSPGLLGSGSYFNWPYTGFQLNSGLFSNPRMTLARAA